MLIEHQLPHWSCQMKGSVIWLSLQRKAQTDKMKAACMKILLVGTKMQKKLRGSHDTTLSTYDDFVQNRFILPLLMISTKLLIKSNMAVHKRWVKASSALQHYYHCWTCLGHSIIPNIPTSAWIWQWPHSHEKISELIKVLAAFSSFISSSPQNRRK